MDLPSAYSIGAVIVSIFLGLLTIIVIVSVWLRTTVGRFVSDERMDDKVVLITGGNSGIGKETVLDLAKRGARVIMASRNVVKANKVKDEIIKATGNDKVIVMHLDVSSLESVREFAVEFLSKESKLDVLINNAGRASVTKKRKSADGIEMTFATNHYGPFLLTHLLIDLLKKSNSSRIIVVASYFYKYVDVDLDNLNPVETLPYYLYYSSKAANIMFTQELAKRLKDTRVTVNCLHPGMVNTPIFRNTPFPLSLFVKNCFKTPVEGAETTNFCAVSSKLNGITGKYFSDCKEEKLTKHITDDIRSLRLWEESIKTVKLLPTDPKI